MRLTVYADTTGLFAEEECERDNLCEIEVPEDIIKAFYEHNKPAFAWDCMSEGYEPTFENWYTAVYTADSTDDFIEFAAEKYGYKPVLAE